MPQVRFRNLGLGFVLALPNYRGSRSVLSFADGSPRE
jgi:hypothetical protein